MSSDTRFFGHPRGLATLFFTELWERFSYYGMRALLILFMTASAASGGLGFDTAKAGIIYGSYTGLVYMVSLPGGWLADRFLGQRKATLWGGIIIMLGHIALAMPSLQTFYLGLGLIVAGTGLLKPNISAMVGQLYAPEDERRDAGFSLFYMGINLGAFLAPLITGWLAQSEQFRATLQGWGLSPESSWHWGFGAAAVGMAFGVTQYVLGWRHLGEAGLHPVRAADPAARARETRQLQLGLAAVGAVVAVLVLLGVSGAVHLTAEGLGRGFGYVLLGITVAFFGWLFTSGGWTPAERGRLVVIAVLFFGAAVFWSVFEQAGSTLNLFADRNTNNAFLGRAFPPSWWQSLNSMFIIALAPLFAWLWAALGKRNPSSPAKFSLGLLFVGLGFAVLIVGAQLSAGGTKVGPGWLASVYLLHTIGELCLSPVGLSAMTKLAPARITGLMMGVWFLAASVGNYLGGQVASLYETFSLPTLFTAVTVFALAAAAVMAALIRPMRRLERPGA